MRQVSLSIETTGFEPSIGHRIIEIGCVELENGNLSGNHFHVYINPVREVTESATEKTGITNEFLDGQPKFYEIKEHLLLFLGDAQLVLYEAPYTLEFLNH